MMCLPSTGLRQGLNRTIHGSFFVVDATKPKSAGQPPSLHLSASASGSVRELIDTQAAAMGAAVFLIDPANDNVLTFAQLRAEVRAVAQLLREQGIEPGQSVAFALHNSRCAVISILGILYGGYRAVAINLVAGRDVIAYVLSHSQSALVLTQSENDQLVQEALSSHVFDSDTLTPRVHILNDDTLDALLAHQQMQPSRASEIPLPDTDSDGLLMYTSGTTGRPKGVILSHGNLIAGGCNVALGHQLTASDRALCVLPLYHINGLCVTIFGPLVVGGSVVLPQRFSTSAFWDHIDRYRCSWFSVVPTQIAYLLRDATSVPQRVYLRFGRSASAPLSPDVHSSFEKRFQVPLIETMGLTETAAQILTNPMPPGKRKLGSPGKPVGDEVKIVDTQLSELPDGQEGELLVRGPNVMQRYFRNPAATHDALVAGHWLRTGDLGRKDNDGYLFITGRLKELIIKGGENIAPREIDDALYQHSDVIEAAAFARPCNDFGQRVEAAVCIRASSLLKEADLLHLCKERVGTFKCPDRIYFLVELPKGPSGKIQRQKLPDLIAPENMK